MKPIRKTLLGSLLLVGLQFAWTGCLGPGGGGSGGVIYGDGPWLNDDGWLDGGGRGWYGRNSGGGAYVHPSGGDRNRTPAPRPSNSPVRPSSGPARAASGGNHATDHGGGDDHQH